ncbi:hypothetical protein FACS189456_2790 [Bacteroidia bacterium]|nr:hypothetical protein FACS189456_2790 [Bacteroidia bacterium]
MNTVVITTETSSTMDLIVALAKKLYVNVMPLSHEEVEEIEDLKLLKMMVSAKEEGLADTTETLNKLGIAV